MIHTNDYHYHLTLPVNFVPVTMNLDKWISSYPYELINQDFIDFLDTLGVKIYGIDQYVLGPTVDMYETRIHTDSDFIPLQNLTKLNYVYCDTPHTMNWFEPKKDINLADVPLWDVGTDYITENRTTDFVMPTKSRNWADHSDLVYSAQIGQPSLVNPMKLHDISTVSSQRVCYCIGFEKSWQEATEIFRDYIIGS